MAEWRLPLRFLSRERRDQHVHTLGARRQLHVCEIYFLQTDVRRTVEPFFDEDDVSFVYGRLLRCGKLQPSILEPYGEVVVHHSLFLHRKDCRESRAHLLSEYTMCVAALSCGNRKACVVVRQVCFGKKRIPRIPIFNVTQSHLFHQSVLQGPKETLDPSLCLG